MSLITAIFSDDDEIQTVRSLPRNDAQVFVDIIDEVPPIPVLFHLGRTGSLTSIQTSNSPNQALGLPDLAPWLRRKCLRILCKICGRQALLPRSLQIPLCYDRSDVPRYRGGYADVWIGDYQGRQVAAKVLRVYSTSDFDEITRVGRLCGVLNNTVGKLTVIHVEVLQGSHDVENPSPSERVTTTRSDDGK